MSDVLVQPDLPPRRRPPARRSALDRLLSEAHRFRRNFTRENTVNFFKTLAWVVPLTVLIWIYAEREQIVPEGDISIPIKLQVSDSSQLVTLLRPAEKMITLGLSGSRSHLDQIKKKLMPGGTDSPLSIPVPQGLKPGELQLSTIAQISNLPIFRDVGVEIQKSSPDMLTIKVEAIKDQQVPVRAPEGLNLDAATFDPPTVRLRMPESLWDQLAQEKRLYAVADVAGLPELQTPGVHDEANVPLIKPFADESVSLSPRNVHAILKVRPADVEWTIPKVPIFVAASVSDTNHYIIDHGSFVANVKVKGPPEKIELLKQQGDNPTVRAVLVISDDKPGPKPAVYVGLPDGVKWVDDELGGQIPYHVADHAAP